MANVYQDLRRFSFAIAYRMLGSVADAEDIVQEALLRLHQTREQGTAIESEHAYLATITTRLAIDHLRSARVQRESYVGTWLPEPLVTDRASAPEETERAESVSMAFLTMLEALSPVERAVFLLREAFDYEYSDIAKILDKSEDNCRQLFARARKHLASGRMRFKPSLAKRDELADHFFAACERGELGQLEQLLAADAVFYGDGGGKAIAIAHPLTGANRIARFMSGIFAKGREVGFAMRRVLVNGQPGAMFFDAEDQLVSVMELEIGEGGIAAIRSVVNPDKLAHLGAVSPLTHLKAR